MPELGENTKWQAVVDAAKKAAAEKAAAEKAAQQAK